jgi:transcriptional regulator with XRE-family HTH domain
MDRLGRVLALFRVVRGLTQTKLSQLSGVKRASICEYEKGNATPDAKTLGRLLSALRFSWSAIDRAAEFLNDLDVLDSTPLEEGSGPDRAKRTEEVLELISKEFGRSSSRLGKALVTLALDAVENRVAAEAADDHCPLPTDRETAQRLWQSLDGLPEEEQRIMIRTTPELRNWALAELLCIEGERLSGGNPDRALKLVELALFIAEESSAPALFKVRLKAFVWAHLGHRWHVKGKLPVAEQAFAHAAMWWNVGPEADPVGLLDEARILGMLASLKTAQRRLPEAHDLISRAIQRTGDSMIIGRLLVSRGKILEEENRWDEAIACLEEATPHVDLERDPRLFLCIRHNLAWLLVDTGRHLEAAQRLPEVRELCRAWGSEFDRFRFVWLSAKVAAADGDFDRAVDLYLQVRAKFAEWEVCFDTALASLELATVYAKQGRTQEVKSLARHLVPVFQAQDVHREALAALTLFRHAAEREEVTIALAEEVVAYLKRARYDPRLKFSSAIGERATI